MEVSASQLFSCVRTLLLIFSLSSGSEAICGGSPTGTPTRLDHGAWGGEGAALTVSKNGAFLEFDCAHGRIPGPVAVQPKGRFLAEGRYLREAGGPGLLSDRPTDGLPAVYSGEVAGSQLTLLVEVPEEGRSKGPFTLVKSRPDRTEMPPPGATCLGGTPVPPISGECPSQQKAGELRRPGFTLWFLFGLRSRPGALLEAAGTRNRAAPS